VKPTVEAFAFTLSFPSGVDEDYVLLLYDALKDYEDSVFRVEMDVDRRIHVAYVPVYSNRSDLSQVEDRAAAAASHIRQIVEKAMEAADRRYRLLKELERAELAVSDARKSDVLEGLVPSVW